MIGGIDYLPAPSSGLMLAGAWIERLRRGAFSERMRERIRLCVWENEGGALFAARCGLRPDEILSRYER